MIDSNGLRDVACPPVNTQVRCDDVDDGDGDGVDDGDDGGGDGGDGGENICSLSPC